MSLSTPWYALPGHVCPFAVRVPVRLSLAGFLGSRITRTLGPPRMERRTLRFGSGRVLDCALDAYTLQRAVPSARGGVLLRCRIARTGSHGISTVSAIAIAIRLRLRARLTPG